MNKRARLNYIHALSTQVEHKKMYKAKKQWVVAGISFLVATGMGAIGSHLTTHAASTPQAKTTLLNNSREQNSSSASNPTERQASNFAGKLMSNQLKSGLTSGSQSTTSNSGMNTLNLSNSSEQAKGWNYVQHGINNNNFVKPSNTSSASSSTNKSSNVSDSSKVSMNLGAEPTFNTKKPLMLTGDNYSHGTWGQASWTFDNNNSTLDISNGQINDDPWNNGFNPKSVKHLYTENVTPANSMSSLFAHWSDLKDADLSGMNTSNVSDMGFLFYGDGKLGNVYLGNIDTHNVHSMLNMFFGTVISDADLSNLDTSNVSDMRGLFEGDFNLKYLNLGGKFNNIKAVNNYYKATDNHTYDETDAFFGSGRLPDTLILSPNAIIGKDAIAKPYPNKLHSEMPDAFEQIPYVSNTDGVPVTTNIGDGKPHFGTWTRNAEIIDYMNGKTNVASDLIYGQNGTTKNASDLTLNVPSKYHVANPNQPITINGGITQVPVNLAITDTVASASAQINSDYEKASALDSANANDDIYDVINSSEVASSALDDMNGNTTNLDGLLTNIQSVQSNLTSAKASDIAKDVTNANNDYYSVYKDNANVEEIVNSEVANLKNSSVAAFFVTSTKSGDSLSPTQLGANEENGSIAPNATYVGKFGDSPKTLRNNLLKAVPNGYHLAPNMKLGLRKVNLKNNQGVKPTLLLGAEPQNTSSSQDEQSDQVVPDVQVVGNPVKYQTTINLHFYSGNKDLSDITLTKSDLSANVGDCVNLLDNKDNGKNSDGINPNTLFSGKTLGKHNFDTTGFTLSNNNKNSKESDYDFQVQPSDNPTNNNSYTTNPTAKTKTINLYFNDNNTYYEQVHYMYGSTQIGSGTTLSGSNDENYNITSSNAASDRLSAGWHLLNSNNSFAFGNDNKDNKTINVSIAPNTITDTIKYQIASNSAYLHQGSVVSSASITLNDDRASGAGSLSSTVSTAPSGYSLESSAILKYSTNLNSSNTSYIAYITPDFENETVNYIYNGNTSNPVSSATLTSGYYGNSASVSTVPDGWQFASVNNSFIYGSNNNVDDVNIEPSSASTIVYYIPSGKSETSSNAVGSHTFTGTNYLASQASTGDYTTNFSSNASSASGMNSGYHIAYSQAVNYGSVDSSYVVVAPNRESATVEYVYSGSTVNGISLSSFSAGSYTSTGNDWQDSASVSNTSFEVDASHHQGLQNSDKFEVTPTTIYFNNNPQQVNVTPYNASIYVQYQNEYNNDVGHQKIPMSSFSNVKDRLVGAKDNIRSLLKAPNGYHFASNTPVYVTLDTPFYSKPNHGKVSLTSPFTLLTIRLGASAEDSTTKSANTKINSDSSAVNSESGLATSMMSNSNFSGATRSSISSESNTIASASSAIHKDINGGTSAESNADNALASASSAYSGASNIASSVASSISSSASASSIASQSSMASSVISSYTSSLSVSAKKSAESSSATSALSNSAKQINSDINSAKNWDQNSSISDGTRKSISNDINNMNSDNSKANQFSGKGTNGSTSAQPYFNNAASAYSDASNLAKSAQNSIASSEQNATNAKSSAASVSASAALSNSTSQINVNISSAKNWTSNSAINDTNKSSITSDISMMSADISEANQYINQGVSGLASAAPYLTSASSAYSAASSLANSAINSYNSSVSASTLTSLVTNAVSNATKSNKPTSASSVSLTSNEEQAIANDIDVNIKPNSAVVTNTVVDSSALTSLTNEVATENQSIDSLANKPAPTATVNYNNFDNLINQGIDRLENTINTDFKATIHHVAKAKTTNEPITNGFKQVKKHIRWIMITKPVKLYNKHGKARALRPSKVTLDVHSVYKVHGHFVFKVSYHHHTYFMADNHSTFKNAYLPKSDKFIGKKVRVLHDVYAYRHKASDKVRTLHRGFTGRIKNIVRLGKYNMTRIQLTNGNWISANKNFVKVL